MNRRTVFLSSRARAPVSGEPELTDVLARLSVDAGPPEEREPLVRALLRRAQSEVGRFEVSQSRAFQEYVRLSAPELEAMADDPVAHRGYLESYLGLLAAFDGQI